LVTGDGLEKWSVVDIQVTGRTNRAPHIQDSHLPPQAAFFVVVVVELKGRSAAAL